MCIGCELEQKAIRSKQKKKNEEGLAGQNNLPAHSFTQLYDVHKVVNQLNFFRFPFFFLAAFAKSFFFCSKQMYGMLIPLQRNVAKYEICLFRFSLLIPFILLSFAYCTTSHRKCNVNTQMEF